MRLFRRLKHTGIAFSLLALLILQLQPLHAAMITNTELLDTQQPTTVEQVTSQLHREQIRQQLIDLGVDPATASLRIDQMSPSEVVELNGKLEQLPAGSSVGGALLTIFIVLIITDMLGATDIFPWVQNINKNTQ